MARTWKEDDLLGLIERTFRFPADRRLILGPGDDCAVLRQTPGKRLVITTDEQVEGTHFLRSFADPDGLACKLMRVNLSDLAGMGAVKPVSCVVAAGLRADTPADFLRRFMRRLKAEALHFGITIAGGNLAGAREDHFTMTVWGEAGEKGLVPRRGTRAGDLLLNVGPLGDSAAGLEILKKGGAALARKFPGLINAFWRPRPMLAEGMVIGRNKLATGMLDNSDGLLRSARILAGLSGLRAILSPGEASCSAELRAWCAAEKKPWRAMAIGGGEDYGLIFSARPSALERIKKLLPAAMVVGRFEKGSGVKLENFDGKIERFEHF